MKLSLVFLLIILAAAVTGYMRHAPAAPLAPKPPPEARDCGPRERPQVPDKDTLPVRLRDVFLPR